MEGIQLSLFGKTSPEHSVQQKAMTSGPSCKRSSESPTKQPMFLDLRKASGILAERSWGTGGALRGAYSTRRVGEFPSVAEESSLSQIIIRNALEKYSLSATACQGILRRLNKRGKTPPPLLKFALEIYANASESDADAKGGSKGLLVQDDLSGAIATSNDQVLFACYDTRGNGNGAVVPTITGDHGNRVTDYTAVVCGIGNGQADNAVNEQTGEMIALRLVLRRLMPVECARLQGFPDWWTDGIEIENPTEEDMAFWREVFETHRRVISGAGKTKTDKQIRKWLKSPKSDSTEYKMWGNGVALPCVMYVMEGIAREMEEQRE